MISHKSGVICGEQINTWVGLLRDPGIVRTTVLTPHLGNVLVAYMNHMVKIHWEDVWDQAHPYARLIEASWDDEVGSEIVNLIYTFENPVSYLSQ